MMGLLQRHCDVMQKRCRFPIRDAGCGRPALLLGLERVDDGPCGNAQHGGSFATYLVAMMASRLALAIWLIYAVLGEHPYRYNRQRRSAHVSADRYSEIDDLRRRWIVSYETNLLLSETQESWHALFEPETSPDFLFEFLSLQRRRRHERAIAEYAAMCIQRGVIPLRQQIRVLDDLFDADPDMPYLEWQSALDCLVNHWKLPGGYAMGIALRRATTLDLYGRVHRQRAHDGFCFLVSTGTQFSQGQGISSDNVDVLMRERRLPTSFNPDDDITASLFSLIDEKLPSEDSFLSRLALQYEVQCDDDVALLIALAERGLNINSGERGTDECCLSRAIFEHRLRDAIGMIMIGADFELEDAGFWETSVPKPIDDDAVTLLTTMVSSAIDPAKVFANFFVMLSLPVSDELLVLAWEHQTQLNPENWAHSILVHLLTGNYHGPIDDVLPLIGTPGSVFEGVGKAILLDFQLCRPTALDDLYQLSAMTTREVLIQALELTNNSSGRTILHTTCMTVDVFRWIRQRVSPSWLAKALATKVGGQSCLDLWFLGDTLLQAVPLIDAYAQHVEQRDRNNSLYDIVVASCNEETLTTLADDDATLSHLYRSATASSQPYLHELLLSPSRERVLALLSTMPPPVRNRLLHVLLMEIAIGAVRPGKESATLIADLCSFENGRLLRTQWPSDGWTPLHRAIAHPSLHYLIPSLVRLVVTVYDLYDLLFVRDNNCGTFLHVAIARRAVHFKLDVHPSPFQHVVDHVVDLLTGVVDPSLTVPVSAINSLLECPDRPEMSCLKHVDCGHAGVSDSHPDSGSGGITGNVICDTKKPSNPLRTGHVGTEILDRGSRAEDAGRSSTNDVRGRSQ